MTPENETTPPTEGQTTPTPAPSALETYREEVATAFVKAVTKGVIPADCARVANLQFVGVFSSILSEQPDSDTTFHNVCIAKSAVRGFE